ncbi:MAG TPA: serine/threonine-protein kinase [Fimbriiglobus sp.]|jgi:serine/threonine-protein kinase
MPTSSKAAPASPRQTKRLVPAGPVPVPDTTDYELSISTVLPEGTVPHFDRPGLKPLPQTISIAPVAVPSLDPETQALFHRRLRLCCLVAAAPFAFFFLCTLTNFIEIFGRAAVGWTGTILSGTVLFGLVATGFVLFRLKQSPPVNTLRVLEITVFGVMGLFFAYWQYAILTYSPPKGFEGERHVQSYVLAAALVAHFNWFALIVFHGVLVPNTLARGVGVVLGMTVLAFAIDGIAAGTNPPTGHHAGLLFALSVTLLSAASGLSIFGTAKTEALRREVESARQAVRELGQYRLRKRLGAGGMGEVYLAEHRLLKRPCAVKRIHPRFLDHPEQIRRFEREVQTTAQLRHPNTVEIYDYGRADDGTFYYVMEYLAGPSLEDLVNRHGPMPAERVLHLMRQVCGALREAHKLGLVHRDIKPSNILLLKDGSPHDQVKLVDFGLVLDIVGLEDAAAKITREGLIVGTPEYMSPEQAQGLKLDERSDLFSLGSVIYYLLTGKEAFHRETSMKTLLAVVSDEQPTVTKANPFVPEDVAEVVGRCLSKDPTRRFPSAADLDRALAACACDGQWDENRAADWWEKHPYAEPGTGTDLNSLPLEVAKP